jgi:hypothetical protein
MSMMNDLSGFVSSRQHERLLRKTVVNENGPGTVPHDFEAFLTFVEEGELPLTGTHQMPRRVLSDLNARLTLLTPIAMTKGEDGSGNTIF